MLIFLCLYGNVVDCLLIKMRFCEEDAQRSSRSTDADGGGDKLNNFFCQFSVYSIKHIFHFNGEVPRYSIFFSWLKMAIVLRNLVVSPCYYIKVYEARIKWIIFNMILYMKLVFARGKQRREIPGQVLEQIDKGPFI